MTAFMTGILRQRSGAVGLLIVILHIAVALLSPLFLQIDPTAQNSDAMMAAPSLAHWFGTDRLGRDVFARTLLGGQAAMAISTVAALIALL